MGRPGCPYRCAKPLLAGLVAVFAAASPAALAAPARSAAADCVAASDDAVVALDTLTDDGDVVLADGRRLRLAGIDLPHATPASPDLPLRVRAALLAWASGPLALHPLGDPDRWGRIPALLSRPEPPGDAAAALVAAGLARVAPEPAARACAEALLSVEAAARSGRRGLWADPAYAVLKPTDAAGLAAQAGGMALVEGILRVHESHGALYLSLGPGRRGFEAVVTQRDAKTFARAGLDLEDYVGTPVRLRGPLDARFGPRLRVTAPDAVESLEPGTAVMEMEPGSVAEGR